MISRKVAVFCATIFLASAALGNASEQPVKQADLPAAVRNTAQEQSQGAVIKHFVKDNEGGQLEYEVEMAIGGHSKDVSIAPDGRLLEIEEQVKLESLPADVRQGLHSRAGRGAITKVESLTKKGQLVAYEAQVRTSGKHSEIQVWARWQAARSPRIAERNMQPFFAASVVSHLGRCGFSSSPSWFLGYRLRAWSSHRAAVGQRRLNEKQD